MSLWHKPPTEIDENDVDAFLEMRQPEGPRLDYKVDVPSDLAKLLAAFANTSGGMILLGVDSDRSTNEPIWPPSKGMQRKPGLDERVTSIARDAVYPPVRIETSRLLDNPKLPGHSILVVRVDESRDAPHATDDGRKVYVRTGSTGKPYEFARLDWISYLLDRRRGIEERRKLIREEDANRAWRLASCVPEPTAWASVIPIYPWRDLCRVSATHGFLEEIAKRDWEKRIYRRVQRIPEGAASVTLDRTANDNRIPTYCTVIRACGHVFSLGTTNQIDRIFGEIQQSPATRVERSLEFSQFWIRISRVFGEAIAFFQLAEVELPGLLHIEMGVRGIDGYEFYLANGSSYVQNRFSGRTYKDELVLPGSAFISSKDCLRPLRDRMMYALDVITPEGM